MVTSRLEMTLKAISKQLATILQVQGIRQNDTISLLMRHDVKYLEII